MAIDNNANEDALHRVAIGCKNWLFAGSDADGRTATTLFSLIATCQGNHVEPLAYLRDVPTRIATTPSAKASTLCPIAGNLPKPNKPRL